MTDTKLTIYNLRKKVLNDINTNNFITAKTRTSLLKQYEDSFITIDKQKNVFKRSVQSQRTQLNKINDTLQEFDVKTHTLQDVKTKIKRKQPNVFKNDDYKKPSEYVTKALKKNLPTGLYKTPFEVTFKSLIATVQFKKKFNCLNHFLNWLEKVTQEKGNAIKEDTYGHSIEETDFVSNKKDLFEYIEITDIKILSGGCNKHTCTEKEIKTSFYTFKLYNPVSMGNNCFFKCFEHILGIKLNIKELRKKYNLPTNSKINIHDAMLIIKAFKRNIEIIDVECNEELDEDIQYILIKGDHYYVVEEFKSINRKDNKTKRGLLTFDFETRKTEKFKEIQATGQKMYLLKDSICCIYYNNYKSLNCISEHFESNNKTSARQFIDWLNEKATENKTYNIIAHNGGNFDFYFIISCMTDLELLECDIQMRGTTIISINYRGNLFKDSYCFLTASLNSLSSDFKIEHGKIISMILHGKKISSSELCFYKNELGFNDFMNLKENDKDFWELYIKYCDYDCIALYEIWKKFTECINSLINKISPYILIKAPLMSCSTIGSHSKKILKCINEWKGKASYNKQQVNLFLGIEMIKTEDGEERVEDYEKYEFICKFKRGGISHCNKPGKHMSGITGADIASQYPASLIKCYIPCGKSYWVNEYTENIDITDNYGEVDEKKQYGFYHLKNVVFDSYLFKPASDFVEGKSLNWATNTINDLYIDTYTIEYLKKNYGLKSFEVVKGLVSNNHMNGDKLFGKYVNTFYNEKKEQDKLKKEQSNDYNPALRQTIKLYLNSLTGKLVEDPSVHYSMKFKANENNIKENLKTKVLNGQDVIIEKQCGINDWITAGIMVYSYSKRLLFEYIKCLPNNSDDIIHVETDGLYFSSRQLKQFSHNVNNYKGDYPVKYGEDLGNLKIEESTDEGQVSYFLGKKFYNITLNNDYLDKNRDSNDKDNIYKIKGVPLSTISKDGSKKYLVDTNLYEKVYKGETVPITFSTLKRNLFDTETSIMAYDMTRNVKPNCEYKFYE